MTGGVAVEERFAKGPPLVLDGATGTELERLGVRSALPLWSAHALIEAPDAVLRVHRAYAEAGAELLTANTFRTQRRTLARGSCGERARELTALAVELARRGLAEAARPGLETGSGPGFVLGSAPPLEDCYRPDLVPDDAALAAEHAEHAGNLVAGGCDAILAETHHTAREAVAAVRAAREAGAPALVSFVCDASARLLSGEALAAALDAVAVLGPLGVGVNCLPPEAAAACLPVLSAAGAPFFVYANLGAPDAEGDFVREGGTTPEGYAEHARHWLDAGARCVGGCCGTGPAHVALLAQLSGSSGARV